MVAMAALLVLAACQREAADRDVVELSGKIFVFNYRVARATYLVTLRRLAPLPEGGVAEASFEDPRGGPPLAVRQKLFPVMEKIVLESPPVHCVQKGIPYAVTIRLLGPSGEEIQLIETSLKSNVDQNVLPSKPLSLGPAYDVNPQVFKPDGSTDFSSGSCPT
nr:lipoprotein [Rhizobium sp. Q54]